MKTRSLSFIAIFFLGGCLAPPVGQESGVGTRGVIGSGGAAISGGSSRSYEAPLAPAPEMKSNSRINEVQFLASDEEGGCKGLLKTLTRRGRRLRLISTRPNPNPSRYIWICLFQKDEGDPNYIDPWKGKVGDHEGKMGR